MSNAKRVTAGNTIPHTPGSALTAGDVVVQGGLVGIAEVDIAAAELGSLAIEGEFLMPKEDAVAHDIGDLVYWDDTGDEVTKTSTDNTFLGVVTRDAASSATETYVKLVQLSA